MKPSISNRLSLWVICAFGLMLTSCDKPLIDYREKFTGDWDMEVWEYERYLETDSVSLNEKRQYEGSVGLLEDGKIRIDYGGLWRLILNVDKEGILTNDFGTEFGFISRHMLFFFSDVQHYNTGHTNVRQHILSINSTRKRKKKK